MVSAAFRVRRLSIERARNANLQKQNQQEVEVDIGPFTEFFNEHLEVLKTSVLAEHERLLTIAIQASEPAAVEANQDNSGEACPEMFVSEGNPEKICSNDRESNEKDQICERTSEKHAQGNRGSAWASEQSYARTSETQTEGNCVSATNDAKYPSEESTFERQDSDEDDLATKLAEENARLAYENAMLRQQQQQQHAGAYNTNQDRKESKETVESQQSDCNEAGATNVFGASPRQTELEVRGPAVCQMLRVASTSAHVPVYGSTASELWVPGASMSFAGPPQIPEQEALWHVNPVPSITLQQVPSIAVNGVEVSYPTGHHAQLNPCPSFVSARERASQLSEGSTNSNHQGTSSESLLIRHSKRAASGRGSRKPSHMMDRLSVASGNSVASRDGLNKGDFSFRDDKTDFKILSGWERAVKTAQSSFKTCFSQNFSTADSTSLFMDRLTSLPSKHSLRLRKLILAPNSTKRIMWDVFCMILTSYDAIVVPMQFLELEVEGTFLVFMVWLTRLFWTLDLYMSGMTGYTTHEGEVEMRPGRTWRKYARTWLAFDGTLVFSDWLHGVFAELMPAGGVAGTKFARIARLIRLVRLTRIVRLARLVASMLENVNLSEHLSIFSNISLDIVAIFYLVHLVACMWYAVGRAADRGWSSAASLSYEPLATRYIISMYWSASVVTGSPAHSSPLGPDTELERIFCVGTIFCAFVLAACFLSSFTSSLTKYHMISSTTTSQFSMLRSYMKQRGISPRLSQRVLRNATHLLFEQKVKTPEEDVKLLQLLSRSLRLELHFEERSGNILMHPLFAKFCQQDLSGMKVLCHSACSAISFCKGDTLFEAGEQPPTAIMFFISAGTCQYVDGATGEDVEQLRNVEEAAGEAVYVSDGERSNAEQNQTLHILEVQASEWVGEPAMWTAWIYRGLLRGSKDGQLISLEGDVLQKLCQRLGTFNMRDYAIAYVEHLNILKGHCSELAGSIDEKEIVSSTFMEEGPINDRVSRVSPLPHSLAGFVGTRSDRSLMSRSVNMRFSAIK